MSPRTRRTVQLLTAWPLILAGPLPAGAQAAQQNYHRPVWLGPETLLFMSDREAGDWELYSMNLDGTNLKRLTEHAGWDGYASVSADRTEIVFDRGDDEGQRLTWMDLATGNTRTLVRSHGEHLGGGHWGPDGRVFFQWERNGSRDVYAVSGTGGEPLRITDTPADEWDFAVSPDGRRLAVVMRVDSASHVEIVDLGSHRRVRLLTSRGVIYGPDWSPDGRSIAYNSDEDGDQEIYVVAAAGGPPRRLTRNDVPDHLPTWSPDGRRLAFTTELETGETLMVIDPDGAHARPVAPRRR